MEHQWVVVAVAVPTWVLLLLVAGSALLRSEPVDFDSYVFSVALLVLGAFAALTSIVIAVVLKRARLVVPTVVAFALGLAAVSWAERLHWRWSRDEFERVAAGQEVDCTTGERCRLGWWKVNGSDHLDDMTIVWSKDSSCYAGFGYLAPRGEDPGAEALTALARSHFDTAYIGVEPWRDGWYELCITT